jgi:hypothetical protein
MLSINVTDSHNDSGADMPGACNALRAHLGRPGQARLRLVSHCRRAQSLKQFLL